MPIVKMQETDGDQGFLGGDLSIETVPGRPGIRKRGTRIQKGRIK